MPTGAVGATRTSDRCFTEPDGAKWEPMAQQVRQVLPVQIPGAGATGASGTDGTNGVDGVTDVRLVLQVHKELPGADRC